MTAEQEHERDALKEALFMLRDHAKGYPAHYLQHPTYQAVIEHVETKLKGLNP